MSRRIDRILAAAEKRVAELMSTLDEDVERIAREFVDDHVKTIVATAFGFEKLWHSSEHEVHRFFEKSPIAHRLMAAEAAEKMLPDIANTANARLKKLSSSWSKEYRRYYENAFDRRMRELVESQAEDWGRRDAEREWQKFLEAVVQDPGELDRRRERQLRGDDDEG